MRRLFFILFIDIVSLPSTAAAQQQEQVAADTIAAINAWRIEQGTWPVKPNPTLEALALLQAEYLLTLDDIPSGNPIHEGRQGEGVRERALWSPYNWPTYGRVDRIAVVEIAYVGQKVDNALGFWQGSEVHRTAALNPAYREIGVAAVPHPYGYVFIVVLGSQPNVLPVLPDTNAGILYLSNEAFWGSQVNGWIRDATQVRLLNEDRQPLSDDWMAWQPTLPIPQGTGNKLYVEFSDGVTQVETEVNLETDRVLLPGNSLVVAVSTPTPVSSGTEPTQTNDTATPPAAALPSTPTVVPPNRADVTLIYDSRSLAILNTSGHVIDLTRLELVQGDNRLPLTAWQTIWLAAPLNTFPANDCLQVWAWTEASDPAQPGECRYQRGAINIAPEKRFWLTGSFEVQQEDLVLATCEATAGRCTISLPAG